MQVLTEQRRASGIDGHLGARNLEQIAKEQLVDGSDYEPKKKSSFCESCVDGKKSTLPFPKTAGERSDEPLGIIPMDKK